MLVPDTEQAHRSVRLALWGARRFEPGSTFIVGQSRQTPHHLRLGLPHKDFSPTSSVVLSFPGGEILEVGMMLARSPVPTTNPANASPQSSFHSFHYAPAPSPRYSSPRVPAVAKSRRSLSNSSAPAIIPPHASQPNRYVAVDAATQYSPMEPMDYATGALLPRVPPTTTSDCHSSKAQKTMAAPEERPDVAVQPRAKPVKPVPSGPKQRIEAPSLPTSPSKRRNSQGPGSISALATDPLQNPSTLAKRVKPDTAPPKVLPLRYELCAVEDVVVLIAHMLGELIETNDSLALKSGHLTRFHSRYASPNPRLVSHGFNTTQPH